VLETEETWCVGLSTERKSGSGEIEIVSKHNPSPFYSLVLSDGYR